MGDTRNLNNMRNSPGIFCVKIQQTPSGYATWGYTGYIIGIFLYNIGLNRIQANPTLILWLTIICSIGLCNVAAFYMVTHVLIVSTSIYGAYAVIRAISLYAGGFPNEF